MSAEVATRASASPNASPLSFHFSVIKKKLNEIADATSGGNKSGHIWVSMYHFSKNCT